jgi:hypothetical protein
MSGLKSHRVNNWHHHQKIFLDEWIEKSQGQQLASPPKNIFG